MGGEGRSFLDLAVGATERNGSGAAMEDPVFGWRTPTWAGGSVGRSERQSFSVREIGDNVRGRVKREFANYGVRMFGLGIPGLLAVVVIFSGVFEEAASSDSTSGSRMPNAVEVNGTEDPNSAEPGDGSEAPTFEVRGGSGPGPTINKCCGRNYYFDADDFACSALPGNSTATDFYLGGIGRKDSNRRVEEKFPDCGERSVVSLRSAAKFAVGAGGVAVDGEQVGGEYCVDRSSEPSSLVAVLSCRDPASFCGSRGCFRKCCPLGQSYGLSGRRCQKSRRPFRPQFYDLATLTAVASAKPRDYGIYLGDACGGRGKYLLERAAGEVGYLGLDGTLLAPAFRKRTFSEKEFCVESVETGNGSRVESFLCFSKSGNGFENSQLQFFLLSLGFIVSSVFLLLTFLVYLCTAESRNLYGKTLMCYVGCLFGAYLCLAVVELKSKEVDEGVCAGLGYSLLFSFLAAFFWLNVMSFDIWKTIRADRGVDRSKPDGGKLRFLWYSLYAWSFPSAITVACAYANRLRDFPYEALRPDIGEENCWFSRKKKGIYLFFVAPISLVIAANVIFYVQTAWKIWKVKSDVKKMDGRKARKFSASRERFLINAKLFVVMGIAWSLEIVSFFAPHPIWYVTDAANALHGVFVFAVFVLKKKVLRDVSRLARAPLERMRRLATSDSDDLSGRKTRLDSNAEGKTVATRGAGPCEDRRKCAPDSAAS